MNKTYIVLFGVVVAVLLGLNLVPLQRGVLTHCQNGTHRYAKRTTVIGIPFAYFSTTPDMHCRNEGVVNDFASAGLWFDLITAGMVLLGAYGLLEWKGIGK